MRTPINTRVCVSKQAPDSVPGNLGGKIVWGPFSKRFTHPPFCEFKINSDGQIRSLNYVLRTKF